MNNSFIVRKAEVSDAEDIYYINKTSLGYDYDSEKQRNKIKNIINDSTQIIFVAAVENKVVGYIHLTNYDVIGSFSEMLRLFQLFSIPSFCI